MVFNIQTLAVLFILTPFAATAEEIIWPKSKLRLKGRANFFNFPRIDWNFFNLSVSNQHNSIRIRSKHWLLVENCLINFDLDWICRVWFRWGYWIS